MASDRLKDRIDQVVARIPAVTGMGEAATKQALIMPVLEGLGYDIWNPAEVRPEYEGDFATKKAGQKEKADIAILIEGTPRVFIECKPVETELDGHEGQLARYFNAVPSVALGVLTNGQEYRFYTDTGDANLMDQRPFFVFRPDAVDLRLDILQRFSRAQFHADAIREFATELFHTARIVSFLRGELDLRGRPPSEDLIRWVLSSERIHEGRVTEKVVERFRPILANALQTVIRDMVRRSVAAIDQVMTEPAAEPPVATPPAVPAAPATTTPAAPAAPARPKADDSPGADDGRGRIQTTDRELEAFTLVSEILNQAGLVGAPIFEPGQRRDVATELAYRDTSAYFGIYFNKTSWWIARLFMENRQPWVGFPVDSGDLRAALPPDARLVAGHAHAPLGVLIDGPADLRKLRGAIEVAARSVIEARRQG